MIYGLRYHESIFFMYVCVAIDKKSKNIDEDLIASYQSI